MGTGGTLGFYPRRRESGGDIAISSVCPSVRLWFRTFISKRLGLGSPKLVCKFIWRYLDQDILLGSKGQRSRSQGSKVDFVTFWQLSYCMQIIGARIIKVGLQVCLITSFTAIHFRDQKVKGQGHRGQTFIFHILS